MKKESSFAKNRDILGETAPLKAPHKVVIDPAEICNLKCVYCFRGQLEDCGYASKNDLMSMDVFYKSVEQVKELPYLPKTINLSNCGEPLCNRKFPEMVKYIKKEIPEVHTETITNAVLLDEKYAKEIAESGLDKMVVSLQGLTGDKYKEVCGKSIDIEKFIANLKVLYDNSVNTKIFVKIVDIALEDGEEEKFYEMFKGCCHYAYVEKAIDLWGHGEDLESKEFLDVNRYNQKLEYQESCYMSFYSLLIIPNGDVYPCCHPLFNMPFGNVTEESLNEIWNGKKRKNFLTKLLKEGRKFTPVCKECNLAQIVTSPETDSLNGYQDEILKRMESYYGS